MKRHVLGVIPARGGSKQVPRKNLRLAAGRPLITWTIDAALGASCIDQLVVSTDDELIARIAQEAGVKVPFMRSAQLAQDTSACVDVVLDVVDRLTDEPAPSHVVLLQPTSPLRRASDIDAAFDAFLSSTAAAMVSISPASPHPYWTKRLADNGEIFPFIETGKDRPGVELACRQDLPPAFALNGAIYVITVETLRRHRSMSPPGSHGFVMPPERSLDIDSEHDLVIADLILRQHQRQSGP